MSVKAALLDKDGVFLRIDELASEANLTERHLPQITHCDHQSGEYRWVPDARNPSGGSFESIAWRERVEETKRKAAEENTKRGRR
jgi:hypothetical protein